MCRLHHLGAAAAATCTQNNGGAIWNPQGFFRVLPENNHFRGNAFLCVSEFFFCGRNPELPAASWGRGCRWHRVGSSQHNNSGALMRARLPPGPHTGERGGARGIRGVFGPQTIRQLSGPGPSCRGEAQESPLNELTLREQLSRDGLFTCLFENGMMREGAESEGTASKNKPLNYTPETHERNDVDGQAAVPPSRRRGARASSEIPSQRVDFRGKERAALDLCAWRSPCTRLPHRHRVPSSVQQFPPPCHERPPSAFTWSPSHLLVLSSAARRRCRLRAVR
ncbi:hypothetical protein EYF80_054597 [Liparis tanakae]|uniref:Uncharacterized protein n=1 Tax=Liparis tanakae TaxID=230148 RepID=A0A4Z2F2G1_9TELE|nr:hypothetical protein EYF80_054597 [Liparis tanakae]